MRVTHTIRKAPAGRELVEVELTRATAIKAFCSECMGWETHPRDCTSVACPLYPFRGRTTLAYGRERTPAQIAAAADAAERLRTAKNPEETPQDRSEGGDAGSESSGAPDAGKPVLS